MTTVPTSPDSPRAQTVVDQLDELDRLAAQAWTVLDTPHYHLAPDGQPLVYNGQPLPDPRPTLAAIDTLTEIIARRCALLGLDAPTRHEYEVDL